MLWKSFLWKIHRRLEAVAARVEGPKIPDAPLTEPLGPFRHDQRAVALGAARKLTGTLGWCRVHGLDRHCSLLADSFRFSSRRDASCLRSMAEMRRSEKI